MPEADRKPREFSIARTFESPRQAVWRAWTEEDELARWLRPFGVRAETLAFDVRVGGEYRYTMVNNETGGEFPTGGVYLEVVAPERLVFTWGEPGAPVERAPVITLHLADGANRTELEFHLRGFDGRPGDGHVYDGWAEALTNLARHLAGEPLG